MITNFLRITGSDIKVAETPWCQIVATQEVLGWLNEQAIPGRYDFYIHPNKRLVTTAIRHDRTVYGHPVDITEELFTVLALRWS